MKNQLLDTSDEFIIRRYGNGIKLVRPDKINCKNDQLLSSFHTVKSILQLPLDVYFLNTESVNQKVNEIEVSACGYSSIKDAIGKTVRAVAKKDSAGFSINHDLRVLRSNKMITDEENFHRLDNIDFQAIATKCPWYDDNNKIIGVFGVSIIVGIPDSYPFSDAVDLIKKMGLWNIDNTQQILSGINVSGTYLSKRESECLKYLFRGLTAKGIARLLNLKPRTVESYLDQVKTKLSVSSKSELIDTFSEYASLIQR